MGGPGYRHLPRFEMRLIQNKAGRDKFLVLKPALGQGPCPIEWYQTLSARSLPAAQLDHQAKGFLAVGVGDRFKRRIAAKRGIAVAVGLGELTPRIGFHVALRDAESIVE